MTIQVRAAPRTRRPEQADVAEVGGKAASLGALLAAGFPVPDGVVFSASRTNAPAEPALVRTAVAELGEGPFAVRSSAGDEDGMQRSHAGMYDTVLEVEVADLADAVERVRASARSTRADAYAPESDRSMAVIVQRMVPAAAAGVALTADPISGDRATTIVTAVRGTGERLVSGAAIGDEWAVRNGAVEPRRHPEDAIDGRQAELVAREALRIAVDRGVPQDVEWAIDEAGALWILQARPMTALPPDVSWEPPAAGAYSRQLRFAEWISEPVTPLFESWLLTAMEERTHADYLRILGQRVPRPYHVVVNGWYFYTLNWATPGAFARNMPRMLWHLIRSPRTLAGINPGTVHHAVPIMEREWRADVRPRHLAVVAAAEARVEALPVRELPDVHRRARGRRW